MAEKFNFSEWNEEDEISVIRNTFYTFFLER